MRTSSEFFARNVVDCMNKNQRGRATFIKNSRRAVYLVSLTEIKTFDLLRADVNIVFRLIVVDRAQKTETVGRYFKYTRHTGIPFFRQNMSSLMFVNRMIGQRIAVIFGIFRYFFPLGYLFFSGTTQPVIVFFIFERIANFQR